MRNSRRRARRVSAPCVDVWDEARRARCLAPQAFRFDVVTMGLRAPRSVPIDRADPSPSSIKTAVDILKHGEILLMFPSGTRSEENIAFRRGAATVALHARVPLVPAFFQGPKQMQVAHLLHRPPIRVTFGSPIPTAKLPIRKTTTIDLTGQLQAAIAQLRSVANFNLLAAYTLYPYYRPL